MAWAWVRVGLRPGEGPARGQGQGSLCGQGQGSAPIVSSLVLITPCR